MTARRLYGKGSCTLCQQRKTRCELPAESLNLPPSPNPLPRESACHRCRTLDVPCILSPASAAPRPPRKSKNEAVGLAAPPTPAASTSTLPLEVRIALPSVYGTYAADPLNPSPPSDPSSSSVSPLLGTSAYSGQYHGRPLELASALLRGSFSPSTNPQVLPSPMLALGEILQMYPDVETRAQDRYAQLCTFAPFLGELSALITLHSADPSSSLTLLLSLILYLCCADDIGLLRNLGVSVHSAKNTTITQSPEDLHAVQAFILLAIFAPFGILPGQSATPSELVVARGYVRFAKIAAAAVSLEQIVSPASMLSINAWYSPEIWMWLSLCAADAAMALESDVIIPPGELAEAQQVAHLLRSIASQAMNGDDGSLGKVLLCERVMRLTVVHSGMNEYPRILEASNAHAAGASISQLSNALQGGLDELDRLAETSDELTGYCGLIGPLQPCLLLRDTERLADVGLLRRTAIRHILALSMLSPSDPHPFSGTAAMSRAVDPASVAELWAKPANANPSVELAHTWIRQRGMALEELLVGILGYDEDPGSFLLLPSHRLAALAIEACSVIVELQAALFSVSRSARVFRQNSRIRPRSGILRHVAETVRKMEVRYMGPDGMYVGDMASRLITSMVDGAEAAAKRYESQKEGGGAGPSQPLNPPLGAAELSEMEIWLYELTNGLLPGDLEAE